MLCYIADSIIKYIYNVLSCPSSPQKVEVHTPISSKVVYDLAQQIVVKYHNTMQQIL